MGATRHFLVAPPPIVVTGHLSTSFYGADHLSEQLGDLYSEIAIHRGIEFFDAGKIIATSTVDGVHFENEAHQALGAALAKKIKTII